MGKTGRKHVRSELAPLFFVGKNGIKGTAKENGREVRGKPAGGKNEKGKTE